MFLSEPGFPAGYNNAMYSCDWGREWVYRHIPTAKGATFTVDQTQFVRAPRVTDVDADALGHIYVSSWKGATFTYVGEDVGFLARGRIRIEYEDGCSTEYAAPDVIAVEPGHDGWVVGEEPVVLIEFDFEQDTVRRLGMPDAHRHRAAASR